jgi:hypothetical protein
VTAAPENAAVKGDAAKTLASHLAGAAVSVTGILGFLGATGGERDRLLRNHGTQAFFALVLVGVAIGIGFVAPLLDRQRRIRFRRSASETVARLLVSFVAVTAVAVVLIAADARWEGRVATCAAIVAVWLILMWSIGRLRKRLSIRRRVPGWSVAPQVALLLVGVVMLAVGLAWLSELAIATKSAKERPRLSASVVNRTDGTFLASTVNASGLNSDEHILVRVEGRSSSRVLAASHAGIGPRMRKPKNFSEGDYYQLLYGAQVGPDAAGQVSYPIKLRVSPALYERVVVSARLMTGPTPKECQDPHVKSAVRLIAPGAAKAEVTTCDRSCVDGIDDRRLGCVTVLLPENVAQPQLFANWKLPFANPPILEVRLRAADIEPARALQLVVRGLPGKVVYRASIGTTATGAVDSTLGIPIAARFRRLCVTAAPVLGHGRGRNQRARCPTTRSRIASVLLEMPRPPKKR